MCHIYWNILPFLPLFEETAVKECIAFRDCTSAPVLPLFRAHFYNTKCWLTTSSIPNNHERLINFGDLLQFQRMRSEDNFPLKCALFCQRYKTVVDVPIIPCRAGFLKFSSTKSDVCMESSLTRAEGLSKFSRLCTHIANCSRFPNPTAVAPMGSQECQEEFTSIRTQFTAALPVLKERPTTGKTAVNCVRIGMIVTAFQGCCCGCSFFCIPLHFSPSSD